MDRHTPTVAELVRQAVEACDPDSADPDLGHLEEQLEDDDAPITTVENIEERLALALEGADFEGEIPSVSVAAAVVLYLAAHHGTASFDGRPDELVQLAVRAQWHGNPPEYVTDWLASR
jgi:hypothetical protein